MEWIGVSSVLYEWNGWGAERGVVGVGVLIRKGGRDIKWGRNGFQLKWIEEMEFKWKFKWMNRQVS